MSKIAVAFCVHDDTLHLAHSIRSFKGAGDTVVFVDRISWNKDQGDWQTAERIGREEGATVILGDWPNESEHRKTALAWLKANEYTHSLIPDGDEIVEPKLLSTLLTIAEQDLADRVYVCMDTYWKSPEYVIRPREGHTPILMLNPQVTEHVSIRVYEGGRMLVLEPGYGVLHHLSYCGSDERILRKIGTWSHKDEIVEAWYPRVWKGWDADKLMRNLHPTLEMAYHFTERIPLPKVLLDVGIEPEKRVAIEEVATLPKVAAAIALHGGEDHIRACLQSLQLVSDIVTEVIVVDNASPDKAKKVAEAELKALAKSGVRTELVSWKENRGFPAASNEGYHRSQNEVVLFLNSDTIVTRPGIIRLMESLSASGSIAAAGPLTNFSAHLQQVSATYTNLANVHLFADDFARRPVEDVDVNMLVGFCMAVRRNVLDELGAFDEAFGIGMFEDNDLSYRIRRAGYRLVVSTRSFIHHHGSATLNRAATELELVAKKVEAKSLLKRNEAVYRHKWRKDIETGFVSELPGFGPDLITFDESRRPEKLLKTAERLAKQADISLCMIVKNEERVLRACLESARPFFREIIVVDTGSTDSTKQIAVEMGAAVYDFPWQDSFSLARNESMKYAKGTWFFWMDADDTLPLQTGFTLMDAAIKSPSDVKGFIVPVQFVDEMSGGTRVDHVKLIRNLPGFTWVGHIHENILPSMSQHPGKIDRIDQPVLHSGYDTSEEGQLRKYIRDRKLLFLDYLDDRKHPFFLFNLGMTQHFLGKHKEACLWLRKCLKHAEGQTFLKKAYALMARSLAMSDRQRSAFRLLEIVTDGAPVDVAGSPFLPGQFLHGIEPEITRNDPELFYLLGVMLYESKQFDQAKQAFLNTLSADYRSTFNSFDQSIVGWKTFCRLADVEAERGNHSEAKRWLQKAADESGRPDVFFLLFDLACRQQDQKVAEAMLERVREVEGSGANWANMIIKHAETFYTGVDPCVALQRAVDAFPNIPAPRLVLSRRLLAENRISEAIPHWQVLTGLGIAEGSWCLSVQASNQGDSETALRYANITVALDPENEQAHMRLLELTKT